MKVVTKIKVWLTIFLLAATTLLVSIFPAEAQIACMGDSITAGYGVSSGQGYCEILGGDNFGVSSKTTTYGLSILDDVIATNPETVIVEYGLNDAYANQVSLVQFKCNLRKIIKRLKNEGIQPVILIANPSTFTSFNAGYKAYVRQMRAIAKKCNVPFADSYREFSEWKVESLTSLYYDDLHPNAEGHSLIADLVFEELGE